MSFKPRSLILAGLLTFGFSGLLGAADPVDNPTETKLREALRNTMLQLRDAQNQEAVLQASQAESDDKIKALTSHIEALTKQSASDKDVSEKNISELSTKVTDMAAQIARYKEALAKWESAFRQAAAVAKEKEDERSKVASQAIILQRVASQRETQNVELFKISNEILDRYEKYSLGQALLAKEPFTGIMRVKLENQVQDYQDKILGLKNTPGIESSPASSTTTGSSPSPSPTRTKK